MKFPAFALLDQDQRAVFSESPKDEGVVIVGPPGSGKTVLALHRAVRLAETGKVTLGMYNKTLRAYTSNFEDLPDNVEVLHVHDWVKQWYKSGFNKKRWPYYPYIGQEKFNIDWDQIDNDLTNATSEQKRKLHWGHLIIDEGQDFSKKMYSTLMKYLRKQNDETLTLSVFADENQTIFDVNSSIIEIREELNATAANKRYWRVDKNYRNTKQVAQFARHFQVLGSGSVTLPDQEGLKPVIFVNKDLDKQIQHIINYCNVQPKKEIGLVVFGTNVNVRDIYKTIKSNLEAKQSKYLVQTYIGEKRFGLNDWENLTFDKPPSITILHQTNSKGLEFDVVFVINLPAIFQNTSDEIAGFKKLYVVSSRPRQHLFYMIEGSPDKGGFKDVIKLFPKPNGEDALCTYTTTEKDLEPALGGMLSDVEWLPSAAVLKREKFGELARIMSELDFEKVIEIFSEAVSNQFDSDHIPQLIERRLLESSDIEEAILDTLVELNNRSIKNIKDKIEF